MDYDVPPELADLLATAREFARGELHAAELELDRIPDPATAYTSDTYRALRRRWCELGFNRLLLPAQLGGPDLHPLAFYLVLEELCAGGAGLALVGVADPLGAALTGRVEHPVFHEYLDAFRADTTGAHSGAWAVTEPDVGADMVDARAEFATTARRTDDGWILNGAKSRWCGNGWLADMLIVMIGVEPGRGMDGTGIFAVPADWPGVKRGEPVDKVGLRALNQCDVSFEDCEVPAEFLLFAPGPHYRRLLMNGFLVPGNLSMGFASVGIAQAAYELGSAYSAQRRQGGVPIGEHQLVAKRLFDAYASIQASRAALREAAWHTVNGRVDLPSIFAARVHACRTALQVTQDMVYVHGANGTALDHEVQKLWRDAQPLQMADGPTDVVSLEGARLLASAGAA